MAYSADPALYIYTSLTAGSSHIVTATARLETILRANRVPFKAIDIATDEKARMLWGRRAGKDEGGRMRKIPGLVQEGLVLGDLVEIEDWNEYGELKQHVKIVPVDGPGAVKAPVPSAAKLPVKKPVGAAAATSISSPAVAQDAKNAEETKAPIGGAATAFTLAIKQAGQEAAQKAKDAMKTVATFTGVGTAEPATEQKKEAPRLIRIPSTPMTIMEVITLIQDSETSAWSQVMGRVASTDTLMNTLMESKDSECMQSPTSTAWRPPQYRSPRTFEEPPLTHRGSHLSSASAECIKKVESEEMILEEEEGEEEA